ncbi:NAD dependent epimerase/dehydratase family protein [Natronincola ferrireducens]|uniref:NAD dependent epimerase/dehydratase family protein n=1 Tax=Natronincola ferrireducens TaxID=393762 RepID=A0A1G9CRH7_9FIRM|nr:NAD dependent epimerase/dehydratase family protein [Natronincola ferrireducens]
MLKVSSIISEDIQIIYNDLKDSLTEIEGSTWLISGGGGFLGSYFLDLLNYCNEKVFHNPCKVICIENFLSGTPERIKHLQNNQHIQIIKTDIVKPIEVYGDIDYIVHAASIASPSFYRKYPIETIEANVLGLKNLLD